MSSLSQETVAEKRTVVFLLVNIGGEPKPSLPPSKTRSLAVKRLTCDPILLPSELTDFVSVHKFMSPCFEFNSVAPHEVLGYMTIFKFIHLPHLSANCSPEEAQHHQAKKRGKRRGDRQIRWTNMLTVIDNYLNTLSRSLERHLSHPIALVLETR
jgi:hypothetical protein